MSDTPEQIETEAEQKSLGQTDAEIWLKKIHKQLDAEKSWREEAKEAEKIFEGVEKANNFFNILHSNVETLAPALYNSQPVPDVRRRFGDSDVIAKNVVDVTERLLTFSLDQYDFDDVAESMVVDGLVAGRGVTRLRYQPVVENGKIVRQIAQEETVCWDEFIVGPAKKWSKVPWIAYIHHLSREELIKLSPEKGNEIPLDARSEKDDEEDPKGVFKSTKIYEIWDKATKTVIFIAENTKDFPLSVQPDPLGIHGFFPSPKPFQPTKKLRSLTPICPYEIYKNLISELNTVTRRIKKLTDQLRVRGVVDSKLKVDLQILQDCEDGEYVAAQDLTTFAQGAGGLEKAIAHWPLAEIITTLAQLYEQRDQIKQTIYEVTGISDILRGSSDARETLGAQEIKTQWGSLRIQNLQNAIAKWSREVFRKKTDIFNRHFEPEYISKVTALPTEKEKEIWPQVMQMFKSNLISFRIDIETDSTIRADMVRSQESMNQFLAATGQFAQAMGGIITVAPDVVPVAIEVYTAFARKFKLGKQAEDALDQLQQLGPEMVKKMQAQGQGEDDKGEKQAAEAAKHKAALDAQAAQQKIDLEKAKSSFEAQKREYELETKKIDAQLKQMQLAEERQISEIKLSIEEIKLDIAKQTKQNNQSDQEAA